jgi:hypothetical protein
VIQGKSYVSDGDDSQQANNEGGECGCYQVRRGILVDAKQRVDMMRPELRAENTPDFMVLIAATLRQFFHLLCNEAASSSCRRGRGGYNGQ